MSASLGRLTSRESFRESFSSFQFSCTQLADMGAMSNEGAAAPARIGTGDTSQRDASLLLSIPACELHQVRPSARFLKVLSAAERCWPRPPIPPPTSFCPPCWRPVQAGVGGPPAPAGARRTDAVGPGSHCRTSGGHARATECSKPCSPCHTRPAAWQAGPLP